MQLDEAERGFSFRLDGPLDMRMGSEGPSAADVVAQASERDLADIISTLGEERHARAVARAIVAARSSAPIATTRALADIVARVVHARPGAHPSGDADVPGAAHFRQRGARRACRGACRGRAHPASPAGRLVVVAFHSLEDRIVKTFLAERSRTDRRVRATSPNRAQPAPTFRLLTKRPVVPDEAEIAANPRARSAKLRAAERTRGAARRRRCRGVCCRGCLRSTTS